MKIKKWLNNNKIYFETIVMTALTIMSIALTCVGLILANYANTLTERQVELDEAASMTNWKIVTTFDPAATVPTFLSSTSIDASLEDDFITAPALVYQIVNTGNVFEGGALLQIAVIGGMGITLCDSETDDIVFERAYNIDLDGRGYFYNVTDYYNGITNEFIIYKRPHRSQKMFEVCELLRTNLEDLQSENKYRYSITFTANEKVYIDYYEKSGSESFIVDNGQMLFRIDDNRNDPTKDQRRQKETLTPYSIDLEDSTEDIAESILPVIIEQLEEYI